MTDSSAESGQAVPIHLIDLDGHGGCSQPPHNDERPADAACRWSHFDFTHKSSVNWLYKDAGLPPMVADALTAEESRPRATIIGNGLLVVLRGVNTNPGADPEDMVSIRLWIEANRIISTRRRKLLSVQDLLSALESGAGPATSGEFLVQLLDRVANRIGDFVDQMEERLLSTEENDRELEVDQRRADLADVRRQLASVRRFIAPQRDALDRLYRQPPQFMSEHDIQGLREEADRVTRYLEDLDLARERAVVLQEEFLTLIAQQQNDRMYVLSVVAAIFLPLTFVTGLLGMNVGGLPGLDNPRGFAFALLIMVAATAGLVAFFRWRRWL